MLFRSPEGSRIGVVHLGQAHSEDWAVAAREEMARNPRYQWRGEVPRWAVRRAFTRIHLMVLSSVMEGGANIISEAAVAGLPVIASDIHGSVGLLGPDYPGYYPVEDTAALTACLLRAEREPAYLEALERGVTARAALFTPEHERAGWVRVLSALGLS